MNGYKKESGFWRHDVEGIDEGVGKLKVRKLKERW